MSHDGVGQDEQLVCTGQQDLSVDSPTVAGISLQFDVVGVLVTLPADAFPMIEGPVVSVSGDLDGPVAVKQCATVDGNV
tara:strand:+ start:274 stop:510 length:237 start_codon:yes stop_codon:yes gene_type:complete